jgi:hypothetical protein
LILVPKQWTCWTQFCATWASGTHDQVRILLLPSVLDMQKMPASEMEEEATLLIRARER